MFIEPNLQSSGAIQFTRRGWIEVISGCMFSGKTEELIRRITRAVIAKQNVRIFKPAIDIRYHIDEVVSHNENSLKSTPLKSATEIFNHISDCQVVGIDEVQFFDNDIVEVCNTLAGKGMRVIVAGLDMDFTGKPFDQTSYLMAIAEYVTKLHAICTICGANASYSYRLSESKDKVLLGEKDLYEARCRECFPK